MIACRVGSGMESTAEEPLLKLGLCITFLALAQASSVAEAGDTLRPPSICREFRCGAAK